MIESKCLTKEYLRALVKQVIFIAKTFRKAPILRRLTFIYFNARLAMGILWIEEYYNNVG